MNTQISLLVLAAASLTASIPAYAITPLEKIQADWAHCQYQVTDSDEQERCFENVIAQNTVEVNIAPNNAELKVWLAINKSSLAGVRGGLGALSLVKESKALFEEVIKQAPQTLNGSAYTSLGTLYYKVPGWPLGFGDDDKAEEMLKKGLEINPNGIDSNYFYADFLAEQGKKAEAKQYLSRAQQAPARANRPLADEGRQGEIARLLEKLK
ncbi:hypothetical protein ATY37_02370 [Vibrio cidicii]|uniref:Uncharacterized protein n=1 Tax=Vibrio cidicii TaxID=1763883 RepID=A0A151L206_9VIBR|nr:tetratricopeptide repeat protein [Vibrio cidicii]KYN90293.1 hypothetical protein ATY37_02370 [Vibrio cidicii]